MFDQWRRKIDNWGGGGTCSYIFMMQTGCINDAIIDLLPALIWINLDHASSEANWSQRKWRIWSTKMADNQHFQYINKLPYFKEIYGKSKLWLKAYSYPRKGHWTWILRWRRWASKCNYRSSSGTDMNKPGSRIQWSKLKPTEMTNLEYQDGGQSAFPIHKQTSLFQRNLRKVKTLVKSLLLPPQGTLNPDTKMAAMSFKICLSRWLRCVIQVYSY